MPHPSSKKKGRALTWVKRATEKARAANPFRHALHVQAVHA
jgi:hypothetical protein